MAKGKSTKAANDAVNEEVKNVTEPAVEEAKVEEAAAVSEAPAEEPAVETAPAEEPAADEATVEETAPAEEPAANDAAVEEASFDETHVVMGPAEDSDTTAGISNNGEELDVKEIAEQFANPEERLNNLGLTEENKEEVVKEELQKVEEVEQKLSKDIQKAEKELPKKQKDFVNKIFRYGFESYWNGVTETI